MQLNQFCVNCLGTSSTLHVVSWCGSVAAQSVHRRIFAHAPACLIWYWQLTCKFNEWQLFMLNSLRYLTKHYALLQPNDPCKSCLEHSDSMRVPFLERCKDAQTREDPQSICKETLKIHAAGMFASLRNECIDTTPIGRTLTGRQAVSSMVRPSKLIVRRGPVKHV